MKKLNKLFAILIAVLGVSATAKADTSILKESDGWQKITALPSNLGDYYYVFVDNGSDLMMTLGSGVQQGSSNKTMWYQASSNPVEDLNKVWTLETNTSITNGVSIRNVDYDHLCLQTEWNASWNFRTSNNGGTGTGVNVSWTGFTLAYAAEKWSIRNGHYPNSGYLGPWHNTIQENAEVACNKSGSAIGYFQVYAISKADFHKLYVDANTTEGEEVNLDLSVFVGNPKIEGYASWWSSTTGSNPAYTTNIKDATTGGFLENWNDNGPVGKMYQTVTGLPNGVYELKMKAFRNNNQEGGDAVYVFANENEVQVTTNDATTYYTVKTTITGGTLEIGIRQDKTGSEWIGLDEVNLTYLGVDLSELKAVVQATYDELNALSKDAVPNAFADIMTALLEKYNTLPNTEDGLNRANNELKNCIGTYNLVNNAYATLQSFITTCESVLNNSEEFEDGAKETFTTAVNSAKTNVETATTPEAINTEYNTLEAARQVYVQKADPTNDTYFDYTFMITNPDFDNGTNGWSCESNAQNKNTATNKTNGIITGAFFENWNGENFTGSIYQTIFGLESGKYVVKVAAFGNGTYIFANDNQTAVTTSDGAWYEVNVGVGEGHLTFGIKNENATTWMGIDNASLRYYGFDATTAQNGVTSLKSKAEALVGTPMNADVATALNNAITSADVTKTTRDELNAMRDALNEAIENAKASIAEYEKMAQYIAKANKIDESIAVNHQTKYNNGELSVAEDVFKELEVATYNYVTENFSYPVALSNEWSTSGTENTAAADFDGEHWSDDKTYKYKNQQDNWDNNNLQGYPAPSWKINFEQEVTLPAGEYVFKVAGRKGKDTTLELVVTMGETELGTVNDFPSANEGWGINKAGAASFDDNDPIGFAKDGKGYGWQWRYVKFTLNAESTVKVAVHAETNSKYNFVSFGDYTLQMTEETYLNANMGGLDAPTAAAEALVDTQPMGADENQALKKALALPVTTGAELLAKIEALETAVANANAWIPKYNEAKAPLVAALERFEADYNDAENGALDHMAKNRWATAISMAQAAAEAKDVTDSYEGFEAATTALVAALDAATVSVGEYTDLEAAIAEANAIANGGNWGDQPFQRSTSAKESLNTTDEQALYDAAEADGEGVTSVTEALYDAINGIELNGPQDGQRYYVKVATAGHSKLGNAVLATLGATGNNNPTGYGLNADNAVKGHLNQAFIFTKVEGNFYNISIERPEGTVYLTYGSLNGSAAGWATSQIQATTNDANMGVFKVEATAKDGVLKIFNTVANDYLDCQDGGSIYTDAAISAEEFNFVLASEHEVTLSISAAGWATLILPFNAELPEGVKAYSCEETKGVNLNLVEAVTIEANKPYLVSGEAGTYKFSGYGMADKDAYTEGLFTGTYVNYTTTANSNTYVLQNGEEGVAFYLVGESAQPTVKANRCYMTYEAAAGAPVFRIGEGTTSIDNAQLTNDNVVIYDLMGRKVNTMEKGGMYIVNGKKVIVK